MQDLRRSEFDGWTLYEVANHFPMYLKLSSLERIGDKSAIMARYFIDPTLQLGKNILMLLTPMSLTYLIANK